VILKRSPVIRRKWGSLFIVHIRFEFDTRLLDNTRFVLAKTLSNSVTQDVLEQAIVVQLIDKSTVFSKAQGSSPSQQKPSNSIHLTS
jgi:hypothetical protein